MSAQTNQHELSLRSVLDRLEQWRHLPAYQLERRADIFLSFVLPEILKKKFKLNQVEDMKVIPEFPLHKRKLFDATETGNASAKVDFAVFSRTCNRIFLVELKTDNNSINRNQLCRMVKVKSSGVIKLLKGVIKCARNTSTSHRKYGHLLWKLSRDVGCITVPASFTSMNWTDLHPGLTGEFKHVHVDESWINVTIELVLLFPGYSLLKSAPRRSRARDLMKEFSPPIQLIDFMIFKELDESHPVASFLIEWATHEAGKTPLYHYTLTCRRARKRNSVCGREQLRIPL